MLLVSPVRLLIQEKTECAGAVHVTTYPKVQFVLITTLYAISVILCLRQSIQLQTSNDFELSRRPRASNLLL
jgi:hypothetical protein